MTRLTLLLAVIIGFALAGCGQSGPLYLPSDPSEIQDAPPPPAKSQAEDEEDEADESR